MTLPPPVHVLRRVDQRPPPEGSEEIRCFIPVRNEAARLPWFLDYHRRLGVDRFFAVDNGSTDGTCELLLGQPDCHVFRTRNSYVEAHYGVAWINVLLDEFGAGHWCLTLDADEQFVYPGSETDGLRSLTRFLDREDSRGLFAFLLDMYGGTSVADAVYRPGTPFLETCPFFDPDYRWVERSGFPPMDVLGGPRLRCFYPELAAPGAVRKQAQRARRLAARLAGLPVVRAPHLSKVPFVRWAPRTRYLTSHSLNGLRLSSVTGALLHFKFFGDFHDRVLAELAWRRGAISPGTWDATSEMRRYYKRLSTDPSFSLRDRLSVRYQSTEQLVELSLVRDAPAWRGMRLAGANADPTCQENRRDAPIQRCSARDSYATSSTAGMRCEQP